MYYSHNLHFIAMCSAMNGDYAEANKNADLLAAHVAPHVKDMPPLEGFMTIPIAVDVRFPQVGRNPQDAQARSGNEDHDRVLAFRARHGPGG
jgi:hypothetical protein